MKKISLFLLSTLMVFSVFTSCSKDDDKDDVNNSIIGSWVFNKVVSIDVKTNNKPSNADSLVTEYVNVNSKPYKEIKFVFKADGTVEITEDDDTYTENYTFVNGILSFIDDYDTSIITAKVENGILLMYFDYTEYINDMELDEMIGDMNIGDPNFVAEKAIATISFNRQ